MKATTVRKLLSTTIPWVLVATLFCIGTASANTTIIATDGFDDGNRTDTTDGLNWFRAQAAHGPNIDIVDDTAGLGSGNALQVTPNISSEEIYGVFPSSVTIPSGIGSSISAKIDFRNEGAAPGGTVRLGIYQFDRDPSIDGFGLQDGAYQQGTTTDPSLGAGGDSGVWVQLTNDNGFSNGGITRLRTESNRLNDEGAGGDPNPNSLLVFGGLDVGTITSPAGMGLATFPDPGQGNTTMEFIVKRVANLGDPMDFEYTFNITTPAGSSTLSGVGPGAYLDGAHHVRTDTFDYIMLMKSVDQPWLIDNFELSVTAVPEPSTFGLLSMVGMLFMTRRRRSA